MESSLKKLESNRYELTVDLGREELSRYIQIAEDKINQSTQIDGFRIGKAPKEKIRERVGDQRILEDALNVALKDSLTKTLDSQKLEVLKVGNLNVKENSSSRLLYTVLINLFPAVTLPSILDIKVKKRDLAVEKKEIDEALEFLRTSRSKFVPKNGPAEKGSRVEVDFEITSGGLPVEGGVSKNHPLIIGDNKFIPGFEEQLVGMKKGDEKKFSIDAPINYFHKAVAGKKLDFSVKVLTIQDIEKPVLDDDFARKLGKFKDLKELEANVRNGILEEKRTEEKQRMRLEIISKINDKTKVELPKDMVIEKLNNMITGFDNELHSKGMELSFYLAHLGKTEDDLRKDWQSEAERQVAYTLILRKIAKDKNLYPSSEEIDQEAEKTLQSMALRGDFNPESIDAERIKNAVTNDLVNEKVFSFLENKCIV